MPQNDDWSIEYHRMLDGNLVRLERAHRRRRVRDIAAGIILGIAAGAAVFLILDAARWLP